MTMLERIQGGGRAEPPRLLVYGPEGIGKSSLATGAPSPIFVQAEDGLIAIRCDRFPLALSLNDVLEALIELRDGDHNYATVVIDSLSALERLIWDQLCAEHQVKSIEKVDGGYARGYMHALIYWRRIVEILGELRQEGMGIVLIAHSKIERFEDPESSAYDRYTPRIHKHASALLCEWVDVVGFATRRIRTESEDAGFNRKRTIAHGIGADGGERILRVNGSPACVAKNRYGITDDLPLEWRAFQDAMFISRQQGELTDG